MSAPGRRIATSLGLLAVLCSIVVVVSPAASQRIALGDRSDVNEYPYFASIVTAGDDDRFGQICGATAISAEWVLTAAHCINYLGNPAKPRDYQPGDIDLVVGLRDARRDQGHRITTCEHVFHPDWDPNGGFGPGRRGDIALLRLCEAHHHPTIALARPDDVVAGRPATAIGFGFAEIADFPPVLQEVHSTLDDYEACLGRIGFPASAAETLNYVCPVPVSPGVSGICRGDSGGPLLLTDVDPPIQVGVSSWGLNSNVIRNECSSESFLTDVTNYIGWIEETTGIDTSVATEGRTCRGRYATAIGTSGDDVLIGSAREDVIIAGAGNDTIAARGGDDRVCAGPGADTIRGGNGNDLLGGGKGTDEINGGAGTDTCVGGKGADITTSCQSPGSA